MKSIQTLCTVAVLAAATSLSATPAQVESLKKEFTAVRTLDLPARAASTVAAAAISDRATVAEDVVRAALQVNGSIAPLLVGSISRSTPDVAAASAATAATIQPKQFGPITKAAIGAAPAQTEQIVTALTKARPAAFAVVGMAAVQVAPKSVDTILSGITAANPTLKTLVAQLAPKGVKTTSELATVLKRAETVLAKLSSSSKQTTDEVLANGLTPSATAQLPALVATVLAAPPVVGPPYTPGGASPGEINTSQTFQAPPLVRYSSP